MSAAPRHWAVSLAALLGCGAAAGRPIVVTNDVAITFTPAAPDVPFDPHSARLAQATAQLTAVIGHAVALQVDTALVTPLRSSLEDALADAVEHLTRDATSLRESRPRAFAREASLLAHVSCRYSALLDHRTARLDAASGTVVVAEPASGGLLEEGLVEGALEDDYDGWIDATLSALPPDRVPVADWEDYFAWAMHPPRGKAAAEPRALSDQEKFDADPRGQSLVRMTRFARIAGGGDGPLARKIDAHLVDESYYLLLAYDGEASLVRHAAPGSLFRRAEAGWVAWLNWRMPALDDKLKVTLAERIFDAHGDTERGIPLTERFPGFDPFAFGLGVADAWARAGHPTEAPEGDARFELMDLIVCPVFRKPDGTHDRNRGCAGRWFEGALTDPALTTRLATALGQRNDPVLVETIFANFKYDGAAPVVTLWRALAPYPAAWRTASQVIVDELLADVTKKSTLVTEAERIWAALPDRRGTALYLMARADEGFDPSYADSRWGTFDRRFGAAVSPSEFGAMLDVSPLAIEVASVVWPALGKGWSRGEAVAARLDAFLEQPVARGGTGEQPAKTVRSILKRECADGALADIAQLHAVLARRAARSPAEATALGPLVTDTNGRHCEK